jgi:hypothetical protein
MPTSKTKRQHYFHLYKDKLSSIIDIEDKKLDKHGLPIYRCKCPVCDTDRGYLRKNQVFIPCKKCGQKGKPSRLKGVKRSQQFSEKISEANERYRKSIDPNWQKLSLDAKKIAHNTRSRLFQIVKTKSLKSESLTGLSWEQLVQYLESKFQPGMTWENYGRKGWHIDHIRPLSSFDLLNPEQLKQACHYTNLQPLWWFDNLIKSDKYER